MATMTAYYRNYELPWTVSEEDQQRLRKLLIICFGITLVLSILLPLLPVPERQAEEVQTVAPRFAKLMLERKPVPPPPPPPPPKIDPQPIERPVSQPKPVPQVDRVQQAREKAAQSGLLPFQEQLAALRDSAVLDKASQTKNLSGKAGATTRAERSLITSKVGAGSGGINTANLSRGYGGGAGALSGHETTQVTSSLANGPDTANVQRGGSGKASRSGQA